MLPDVLLTQTFAHRLGKRTVSAHRRHHGVGEMRSQGITNGCIYWLFCSLFVFVISQKKKKKKIRPNV